MTNTTPQRHVTRADEGPLANQPADKTHDPTTMRTNHAVTTDTSSTEAQTTPAADMEVRPR